MDYWLFLAGTTAIYALAALSLNLQLGVAGVFSVAHGAFMAVGAYSTGILMVDHGWPFWAAFAASPLIAGVVALVAGLPTLRTRGESYVVMSFAMQVVLIAILLNWQSLTRGPIGIPGVPRPSLFGYEFVSGWPFALFAWGVAAAVGLCLYLAVRSPFGLMLRALREDEGALQSLGKPARVYKLVAFVLGAAVAGMAGALLATHLSFIEPNSFGIPLSVLILAMVIVGGAGNPVAPIVGAVLIVALPELLRELDLWQEYLFQVRQIAYGLALIAVIALRPQGLLPEGMRLRRARTYPHATSDLPDAPVSEGAA
jgi:branched-chain amino acid transport system permease protein